MSINILKGAVDQSVEVRVLDSADGTPEAAFAFDTAGIALWYRREGGAKVAITPADLAALTTAHADGGVKYISDGYVRIDVPDAAFATGATSVVIGGSATDMVIVAARVNLVAFNPQDAVRLGLTAMPNAAADAAGGLPISDAGGLDLDAKLANTHEITAARMGALTDWIDGGRLDLILDARASQASVDTIDGIVDAILLDTAEIGAAGAGLTEAGGTGDHLTAIPWNATWDAEVQSEVDDALIAKGLDHLVFASVAGTDIADDSIFAKLVSKSATADWDTFVNTTDALEAQRDNIGTAGAALSLAKTTNITGFNDLSAADVNAEVDTALADIRLDELLFADSDIDGAAPPTVGSVFHELMSATAGSFTYDQTTDSNEALRDRGDSAWATASGFALASVCTEARLAELDAANLPTDVANVKSDTAAILIDTNELQTDWADAGRLDTILDAIKTDSAAILIDTAEIGAAGAGLSGIPKTGFKLASDGLDLVLVATIPLPTALRRIGATTAGVLSGAGTDTEIFKDFNGVVTATATVDASGNRTTIVWA